MDISRRLPPRKLKELLKDANVDITTNYQTNFESFGTKVATMQNSNDFMRLEARRHQAVKELNSFNPTAWISKKLKSKRQKEPQNRELNPVWNLL